MAEDEILAILPCLRARVQGCSQGEYVLRAGDSCGRVYVVLEGGVSVVREDWWGNRNIVTEVGPSGSFAEAYACTPGSRLSVSVVATRPTMLLALDAQSMLRSCNAACSYHGRLMENLVATIAGANLRLNGKLSYLSQRSTREKILAYLSDECQRRGSRSFSIPFKRQQLADFLSVNRSALSAELGRMRDEGIIDFERSRFTLLEPPRGR